MMMMVVPTFAVTTAHPFVLTVSHGLLFRQPLLSATARLPPLLSIHPKSITSAERRTKFRLNVQSRYSGSVLAPAVTTPANQAFPGVLAAAFKTLRGAPATIAYAPNP